MVGMFEEAEVQAELDKRLKAAGIDPEDPAVDAIKRVVSAYFAERTADVLKKVQEVLDKVSGQGLH